MAVMELVELLHTTLNVVLIAKLPQHVELLRLLGVLGFSLLVNINLASW
jgi:hypothetical protein